MEDKTPTIIGAYDWQSPNAAQPTVNEMATTPNTNCDTTVTADTLAPPPEADTDNSDYPPETPTFTRDMWEDERIWKQQYKTISREIVGPPYQIDFSKAAFQHMKLTTKEDLRLAYDAMETILRFGPHTDNHITLVSHDTWLATTFNLLRAATIGLMRASAYTDDKVMACLWDLEGPFPPPQYLTSRDGRDVWLRTASLCYQLAEHIPAACDGYATMENYRLQYEEKLMKATQVEVDACVANWKEARIKAAQSDLEKVITEAAVANNKQLFLKTAQKFGLTVLDLEDTQAGSHAPVTPGGPVNRNPSAPTHAPAPRRNPPRGARHSSQSERASEPQPAPGREPSPTPRPRSRKAAAPAPSTTTEDTVPDGDLPRAPPVSEGSEPIGVSPTSSLTSLPAKIERLSTKMESSLDRIIKRLEALERGGMPPPAPPSSQPQARQRPPQALPNLAREPPPQPLPR